MKPSIDQEALQFWNQRAGLGQWAGTRDVTAKQLEMRVLSDQVQDGMKVLEVGCGNGITALEIARRKKVHIIAFDYAEAMIAEAKRLAEGQTLAGSVEFHVGDVRQFPEMQARFDLIYTERVIINLLEWSLQSQAIADITSLLAPGGVFAMCENSQDALDNLNALRAAVDLPAITPPWHNRYMRDAELGQWSQPGIKLEKVVNYSSTYYFLSRVVNAALAAQEGREPDYDAPINSLALKLPSSGDCGQGRLWLWRRVPS